MNSNRIKFNIIVNLNSHEVKIIAFEDAQIKTTNGDSIFVKDIALLFKQIKDMINNLFDIDTELREKMVQIFETTYYEEVDK